jgi:hypothetical protein
VPGCCAHLFFFAAHPGCALLAHNMHDSDFTRGSKLRHPLRQPSPTSVPKFGWRTQNTLGPSLQQHEANAYAYGSDVLGRLFLLVPLLLPRRRRRLNSHLPLSWGTALPLVPFAMSHPHRPDLLCHPHRPDLRCPRVIPTVLAGIRQVPTSSPTTTPRTPPPMSRPNHPRQDLVSTVPGIDDLVRIFITHKPSPPTLPGSNRHRQPCLHLNRP